MKNWIILCWMITSLIQMIVLAWDRLYLSAFIWLMAFIFFGAEGMNNYVKEGLGVKNES